MSIGQSDCDVPMVLGAIGAFALPLTMLIPGFSIWDVVPKIRVTRCHVFAQHLTWPQLNAVIIVTMLLLFCFYLEFKKRKLDDMVESVMTVSQATDTTLEQEKGRQAAALQACVELLDASAEHYENLVLLRDELRKRDNVVKHRPPSIQISSSNTQNK